MKRITRLMGRHLEGDAEPVFSLPALGGTIHRERTDETLTAYGGLVAYSAFVKKLGWLDDLAVRFPGERSRPNALPVADVLRSFELNCLREGRRFAHVRAVQNDPAVAPIMGMKRVPGEDAFPRLVKSLPPAKPARGWRRRNANSTPRCPGSLWLIGIRRSTCATATKRMQRSVTTRSNRAVAVIIH